MFDPFHDLVTKIIEQECVKRGIRQYPTYVIFLLAEVKNKNARGINNIIEYIPNKKDLLTIIGLALTLLSVNKKIEEDIERAIFLVRSLRPNIEDLQLFLSNVFEQTYYSGHNVPTILFEIIKKLKQEYGMGLDLDLSLFNLVAFSENSKIIYTILQKSNNYPSQTLEQLILNAYLILHKKGHAGSIKLLAGYLAAVTGNQEYIKETDLEHILNLLDLHQPENEIVDQIRWPSNSHNTDALDSPNTPSTITDEEEINRQDNVIVNAVFLDYNHSSIASIFEKPPLTTEYLPKQNYLYEDQTSFLLNEYPLSLDFTRIIAQ